MESIILIFLFGTVIWFWFDTLHSLDRAKILCKQACEQYKLQLLDDTIVLTRVRLKRNSQGQVKIQRAYSFEFSDTGNNRQLGFLLMLGTTLEILELPGYVDRTISLV